MTLRGFPIQETSILQKYPAHKINNLSETLSDVTLEVFKRTIITLISSIFGSLKAVPFNSYIDYVPRIELEDFQKRPFPLT